MAGLELPQNEGRELMKRVFKEGEVSRWMYRPEKGGFALAIADGTKSDTLELRILFSEGQTGTSEKQEIVLASNGALKEFTIGMIGKSRTEVPTRLSGQLLEEAGSAILDQVLDHLRDIAGSGERFFGTTAPSRSR